MAKSLERITFESFIEQVVNKNRREFNNLEIYSEGAVATEDIKRLNDYLFKTDAQDLINYPITFDNSRFNGVTAYDLYLPRVRTSNFEILNSDLSGIYMRDFHIYKGKCENTVMIGATKEDCRFDNVEFSSFVSVNNNTPGTIYTSSRFVDSVIYNVDHSGSLMKDTHIENTDMQKINKKRTIFVGNDPFPEKESKIKKILGFMKINA